MLHIQLLGEFRLLYGDQPPTSIDSPRLQSLLAYLLLHRATPQSRRHLAYLLYPDYSESKARKNLRNLFYQLRLALPDADRFISAETQTLMWRTDTPFTLDVSEFEVSARQGNSIASLQRAVELYRGDLLLSCYDDWISPERERLRQLFIETLERLILLLENQRDYRSAITYAERLLRTDPMREETYRLLMRLHTLNADRSSALRVYHACVTILQRELGVEPSAATREVYTRLLHLENSSPSSKEAPAMMADILPLVGRAAEWTQLKSAWLTAMSGCPHLVLLSGEAGAGKTRLAEELLIWTSRQGIASARAHCYAAEGSLAYAPVTTWLRACPPPALADVWLTEVARLLPELMVNRTDLRPGPLTEAWQRQHLFEALARAVLGGAQPRLLFIDDLQWCDRETLEWLHYLLRFDAHASLLVLGTQRLEETPAEHPLVKLLAALTQRGQLTEIEVGPLTPAETATLAANIAGRQLTVEQATSLYQQTEGNPLFVVEFVRAGLGVPSARSEEGDSEKTLESADSLPTRVQQVLAARLAQLSPHARKLVNVAATIGRDFRFEVLVRVSGESEETLISALDELWQRRIVREYGTDAYDFSHDKIREVAYQSLRAPLRRSLHRQVAEALQMVYANRLEEFYGLIGEHHLRGERWDKASDTLIRAGEGAAKLYAYLEAGTHYARALEALSHLLDSEDNRRRRVDVLIGQLRVSFLLDPAQDFARMTEAEALAQTLPGPEGIPPDRLRLARIYCWMWRLHFYRNELQPAMNYCRQVLTAAEELDDEELRIISSAMIAQILLVQGQFGNAARLLIQAVAPLEKISNGSEWIRPVALLGSSLTALGRYAEGVAEGEQARARAREMNSLSSIAASEIIMCLNYLMGGNPARAREVSRALLEFAEQVDQGQYVYIGLGLSAWAESRLGNHPAAIKAMTQCKTILQSLGGRMYLDDWFAAANCEIAFNAGLFAEALTLAEQAAAYAQSVGGIYAEGLVQRTWGQALMLNSAEGSTRWEEAESHLAESLRLFEAGEAWLEAARTHRAWATLCRQRGDLIAARQHFEKAAEQFQASGLLEELKQTQDLMSF